MKITKDVLEALVLKYDSYSNLCRALGKVPIGGNVISVKKKCKLYNIDTSHFLEKSWAKNKRAETDSRITAKYTEQELFVCGMRTRQRHRLLLIKERGHRCERCGNEHWLGNPINLEVEHKDGNNMNSVKSNLELLCPNCHSCTPTWKGRNIKLKQRTRTTDTELFGALKTSKTISEALARVGMSSKGANYKRADELLYKMYNESNDSDLINVPPISAEPVELAPFTKEELQILLWSQPTTEIAKKFNMSDNGIARWAKKWSLPKPPRGYWQKLRVSTNCTTMQSTI